MNQWLKMAVDLKRLLLVAVLLLLLVARMRRQLIFRQRRLLLIQSMRSELETERESYALRRRRRQRWLTAATVFVVTRHIRQSAYSCRQVWMKERNTFFLERIVSSWSDAEFKENFRVSRVTFEYLCAELKPRLQRYVPLLCEKTVVR